MVYTIIRCYGGKKMPIEIENLYKMVKAVAAQSEKAVAHCHEHQNLAEQIYGPYIEQYNQFSDYLSGITLDEDAKRNFPSISTGGSTGYGLKYLEEVNAKLHGLEAFLETYVLEKQRKNSRPAGVVARSSRN